MPEPANDIGASGYGRQPCRLRFEAVSELMARVVQVVGKDAVGRRGPPLQQFADTPKTLGRNHRYPYAAVCRLAQEQFPGPEQVFTEQLAIPSALPDGTANVEK